MRLESQLAQEYNCPFGKKGFDFFQVFKYRNVTKEQTIFFFNLMRRGNILARK